MLERLRAHDSEDGDECYVCAVPLQAGHAVCVLVDADGLRWFVHAACMDQMDGAKEEMVECATA